MRFSARPAPSSPLFALALGTLRLRQRRAVAAERRAEARRRSSARSSPRWPSSTSTRPWPPAPPVAPAAVPGHLPEVIVDGSRQQGGADVLRSMRANEVSELAVHERFGRDDAIRHRLHGRSHHGVDKALTRGGRALRLAPRHGRPSRRRAQRPVAPGRSARGSGARVDLRRRRSTRRRCAPGRCHPVRSRPPGCPPRSGRRRPPRRSFPPPRVTRRGPPQASRRPRTSFESAGTSVPGRASVTSSVAATPRSRSHKPSSTRRCSASTSPGVSPGSVRRSRSSSHRSGRPTPPCRRGSSRRAASLAPAAGAPGALQLGPVVVEGGQEERGMADRVDA